MKQFTLGIVSLILLLSLGRATKSVAQPQLLSHPAHTIEGTLANGMHYIVLPNKLPRHDIELRLVMRVGSLQEQANQHGGAHFLEHMAFAGTKHFPNVQWVDFFERMGMKYGRDINAFTGFDRTIYWLTLPAPISANLMDSTLLAVRDVLDGISFQPEAIKSERGVILEELRGYNTGDDFYNLKIGKGIYPQHMPLGTEVNIKSIGRSQLVDFYNQWYLPRYATLIVVGNVEATDIEARIKKTFADISKNSRSVLTAHPLTYNKGITIQTQVDENATTQRLELIIPHPTIVGKTIASAVDKERNRMLVRALNARMAARGIKCDVSDAWYLASTNHWVFAVSGASRDSVLSDLQHALSECQNVVKRGFSDAELNQYKQFAVQSLKPDTMLCLSTKWVDDFVDYVISGDRYIHTPNDVELVRKGIMQTTSSQMQKLMKGLLNNGNHTLLVANKVMANDADTLAPAIMRKLWKQALKQPVAPYIYKPKLQEKADFAHTLPVSSCLSVKHADISPLRIQHFDDLSATEYTLSNGLTLLCRHTYEQDSTVHLSLLSRGGLSDLSQQQYPLLKDAASYVDMGGLAHVSADTLQMLMVDHNLSMSIGIDNYWHQLLASSPTTHAQELFNLVYEKLTAPGRDYKEFQESRKEELATYGKKSYLERMLERDPDRMLSRTLDSIVGNGGVYGYAEIPQNVAEKVHLDSLTDYYIRLFSNPRQTIIVLTGNLAEDVVKKAINTFSCLHLAAADTLSCNDHVYNIEPHSFEKRFENSVESQSVLNVIYAGNYSPSLKNTLTFKLMRDILQDRMLSILRKQMNIVYSPYADLYYIGRPQQVYYFWLTVAVKKENREKALSALRKVVTQLQQNVVDSGELSKMKRAFQVNKRKMLSDDAAAEWKSTLTSLVRNGESIADFNHYDEILQSITPNDIRKAFQQYIKLENTILLTKE